MIRLFLAFLILSLSACGFHPVHSSRRAAESAELAYVKVATTPGRLGQVLNIALEDALHPDGDFPDARYVLSTTILEIKQPIIIERDAEITRYNLQLISGYQLTPIAGGAPLMKGTIRRLASYNVSNSDFSTFIAERDARERGLEELARELAMRVAAHFAGDVPVD